MWKVVLAALLLTASAAHAQIGGLGGTGMSGGGGSTGGGGGGPQITATTPAGQTPSATYTQRGVYLGFTPAALDYSFNSTACGTVAPSPSIVNNDYLFTATAPASAGTYTVTVCDHANHGTAGTSTGTFVVASGPTIVAIAPSATLAPSASYTQTGSYAGFTPTAIDYSFDGTGCASAATSPTISGGNISFTNTAPSATGSHTITLCDHANHATLGISSTFTVNVVGGPLDVVAGASGCWMFASCSAAITTAATQNVVGLYRASDSHKCNVKIANTAQLVATVSGCTTSGDNGTSVSSWCSPCQGNDGSNSIPGWYDQSGNTRDVKSAAAASLLTASCFSTFYCYNFSNGAFISTAQGSAIVGSVFTIIAWVKPTTLTNGSYYAITGCDAATVCNAGGGVEFRLAGQAGDATGKLNLVAQAVANVATSTCSISINAWHSVALTYDGSGNYAFYADGAACGSGTAPQTFTWGTSPMMIGGTRSDSPAEAFIGPMRGVVTYTSALSSANTIAIMATGP